MKEIKNKLKSASNLESVINNGTDSIWSIDRNYDYIVLNDYFKQSYLAAYNIELKSGMNVFEILSDELKAFWKPKYDRALSGDKQTFEFYEDIQNERYHFEVHLNPIFDDNDIVGVSALSVDITERKLTEQIILSQESRLRSIFSSAPIGIGVVSDRILLDVNDRLCEMTGYAKDELINKKARMLYPTKKDFDYVGKEKYIQIKKHGTGSVETRFKRKDGKIIDIILSSTPIDINDLSKRVTFTALDITDRKQMENTLRESEERFKQLVKNSSDMIAILDENGEETYVSESVKRITGFSSAEVLGHSGFEFLHPDDVNHMTKTLSKILKAPGTTVQDEYRHKRKNGGWVHLEAIGTNYLHEPSIKGIVLNVRDITERKRAELALKQSQDLMQYVIEHNNSAIAVHDKNLNYIYVSQNYLDQYNVKEKDVIGKHHYDVFPDLPQKWRDAHQKALAGVVSSADEDSYEREDGTIDWTKWECRPWYDADGSIGGIIVYTEVITERKQSEEKIANSEKNFRDMVDNLQDGVAIIGDDTKFIYTNPKFSEITGYSRNELLKMNGMDFTREEDKAKFKQKMKDRISGKVINEQYERIIVNKNGNEVPVEMSTTLTTWQDKKCPMAIIHDVTGRKKSEEKVLQLSTAVDQSPVSIVITDTEGTIEYVNPFFEYITGYSSKEAVGLNPSVLKSGTQSKKYYKEMWTTILNGKIWIGEFHNKRKNGDLYWESATISPIVDEDGKIVQFIAVKEDITEQKLAKSDMQHLNVVLRTIRNVNKLIVEEKDTYKLISKVCKILTVDSGYYNAWLVLYDKNGKYLRSAESEVGENFAKLDKLLKAGKLPFCGVNVLEERDIVLIREPIKECTDCPLSEQYGDSGGYSIRIEHGNEIYGILTVSIDRHYVDEPDEQSLFKEVAGDIGFALYSIYLKEKTKNSEKRLKAREKNFKELIVNFKDGVAIADENTKFIYVNNKLSELTGYSVKELYKMSMWDLTHEDDKEDIQRRMIDRLSGREVKSQYIRTLIKKDGTEIITEMSTSITIWRGEKRPMAIISDITERKKAEDHLKNRNKELELFNEITVGRELKMIELKKEINDLYEKSGKKRKYKIPI